MRALADPPAAAAAIFGVSLPAARRYAELLAGPGVQRGLLGPAEPERIWERHLLNCAVLADLLPSGGLVADLGSGAGLPGIVLAIMRPDCRFVLVEPMARRTIFLTECVEELGLANTTVRRARAEDVAGDIGADVVTARAVAALDRLAPLAVGLARRGGQVLAMKGESAERELDDARSVLDRLGVTDAEVVIAGSPEAGPTAAVIRFLVPGTPAGRLRPTKG